MDSYMTSDAALCYFCDQLKEYAVILLDVDGNVVRVNEGASILKGYSREEMIGMHFSRFYPPESNAVGHPERELATAAAVGRYEEEGWHIRKNGSRFWAHIVITAVYGEDREVRGYAKILRDFTEQKQISEQSANLMKLLEFTASTDYLTSLDNRRSFDKELIAATSAARRHERPISLAMIDLDHFKDYNDAFGHFSGDEYLRQASSAWQKALRPEDFLARYGGEEFIVILRDTDVSAAMACMERVRLATPPALTCSIGIAQWDLSERPNGWIGRADRALYQAKGAGRNRTVFDADPLLVTANPEAVPHGFLNDL
jgi:diguanylate cyclase (GGDEF)-like protein/PAS domain S-box-containing protein